MPRIRRVIRFLAIVAAGTAVVVAVLVLWLDRQPLPPASGSGGAAKPPARPTPAPSAPPDEAMVSGTSPLARRLAAGDRLWSLRAELQDNLLKARRISHAVERLLPHLLLADRWEELPDARDAAALVEAILRQLTEPRRDTSALKLVGAEADDPLGERMLLRMWTLDGGYPAGERERAQTVLEQWLKVADLSGRGGFDVIVTPQMGREIFPLQGGPDWAAGIYFAEDDYCVARADLWPDWRQRTVQHELAHALCRYLAEDFSSSRFVSEGIAGFLEHARPGDWRIDYGPERFANELAALEVMLRRWEAAGAEFPDETVQILMGLDPPRFYALRHFGYLVGLAAVGYVGGRRVEDALRLRTDAPLREVFERLDWRTLRLYVAAGGRIGRPQGAFVVEDGGPGHDGLAPGDWRPTEQLALQAWKRLGVRGTLRSADLVVADPGSPFDDEVVAKVIAELFGDRPASVIVADLRETIDEPLDLRPWSTEFPPLSYEKLRVDTPREFVDRLWGLTRRPRSPRDRAKLIRFTRGGQSIPERLREHDVPFERLIVCAGDGAYVEGGDVATEWKRLHAEVGAGETIRAIRKAYPRGPEVALVIDLGAQPTKYALHWTYVLAAASDFQSPVAYWNPRLPRR